MADNAQDLMRAMNSGGGETPNARAQQKTDATTGGESAGTTTSESGTDPQGDSGDDQQDAPKPPAKKKTAAKRKPQTAPAKGVPMPQLQEKGELFQMRIYPPELAQWLDELTADASKMFDCPRGAIAGIVLGVAREHWDEVLANIEAWRDIPADDIAQFIWQRMHDKATTFAEGDKQA